jgi:hypothetical protein
MKYIHIFADAYGTTHSFKDVEVANQVGRLGNKFQNDLGGLHD